MTQTKYSPAVDVLRIIAILAVILIHTSTKLLESSHMDLSRHIATLISNQLSRFAVPLFFLISGFVLELSSTSNYFLYFKKRISKILIPYIFWSAIYFFFVYTQQGGSFLTSLLTGGASYQLYFIPALLIFYLIFPFIHSTYRLFINKYSLVALGLLELWLLNQDYHLQGLHIYYPINIAVLNSFVFLLGIAAYRNQDKLLALFKKFWPVLLLLAGLLGAYVCYEGYTNYYLTYNFSYYYSQWRPSVLLYTLSLAGGLYYLFSSIGFSEAIIKKISSLSFLVFFIHVIVLETVWKLWVPNNDVVFFGLVASISFGLGMLIHKIPKITQITG